MKTDYEVLANMIDMAEASRAAYMWLLMKGRGLEYAINHYDTVLIREWEGDMEDICRGDHEQLKEDIPGGLLDFIDFKGYGESLLKDGVYEICGKWIILNACDY